MDKSEIEQKLKEMIVERLFLQIEPEAIETAALLTETYGIDSVSLLELVVGLEEVFGIQVEDGEFDLNNFQSVAALSNFVSARL